MPYIVAPDCIFTIVVGSASASIAINTLKATCCTPYQIRPDQIRPSQVMVFVSGTMGYPSPQWKSHLWEIPTRLDLGQYSRPGRPGNSLPLRLIIKRNCSNRWSPWVTWSVVAKKCYVQDVAICQNLEQMSIYLLITHYIYDSIFHRKIEHAHTRCTS